MEMDSLFHQLLHKHQVFVCLKVSWFWFPFFVQYLNGAFQPESEEVLWPQIKTLCWALLANMLDSMSHWQRSANGFSLGFVFKGAEEKSEPWAVFLFLCFKICSLFFPSWNLSFDITALCRLDCTVQPCSRWVCSGQLRCHLSRPEGNVSPWNTLTLMFKNGDAWLKLCFWCHFVILGGNSLFIAFFYFFQNQRMKHVESSCSYIGDSQEKKSVLFVFYVGLLHAYLLNIAVNCWVYKEALALFIFRGRHWILTTSVSLFK